MKKTCETNNCNGVARGANTKCRKCTAAWLRGWYANSAGGMVLADYAAGNVKTIRVS